ncbi:MAG: FAD-dependent urate hydroxylase HpxO [Leptolyngbya sp. SIO3F4]|nr:FAD-dependent urate hydroxylase HpxO [Leptolyngbya sp. SIO3F4]
MNNLKVVIVGAGMAGLTVAIALRQAGYDVEIYDRVRELRPAGAGISLWSNGIKVLNRLGLGAEIAEIGGPMQRMAYLTQNGSTLTDFSLEPLVETVGQCPYPVARTDLQQMLLTALGADQVQLNSRCIGIEQTETSATAIFADGRRATGDLVIAADGTHSVIRNYIVGHTIERRYAGYVNWNGLVPVSPDLAPSNSWVIYVGNGQRASMMPVGRNQFYFFLDVPLPKDAPPQEDIRSELTQHFEGWATPVQSLIQRLNPEETNRIPIHDVEPLPQFVRGRVALMGDAAHSTSPDLGQGGCQALEDAWTLTTSLVTTNIGVADALQRYEAERKERTAEIILKARERANMIHGKVKEKTEDWYEELAQEDGSRIMGAIAKIIQKGPFH